MGEVGKIATTCSMGLVLVEFGYEYMGEDGCTVSIKPNERYTLLAKTNDHWWQVCKDEQTKPFYIPAKYVKELPSNLPSPLDFIEPSPPQKRAPSVPNLAEKSKQTEVTIRKHPTGNRHKAENRMSTFGVPLDIHDPPSYLFGGSSDSLVSLHQPPVSDSAQQKRPNLFDSNDIIQKPIPRSLGPADVLFRQAKPVEPPSLKHPIDTRLQELKAKTGSPSESGQKTAASSENIYESILDLNMDEVLKTEPSAAATPSLKAEHENPTTNVSDILKLPPPLAFSSSFTGTPALPLRSPEWEVQTDQDGTRGLSTQPLSPHSAVVKDITSLPIQVIPPPLVSAPASVPPTVSLGSDFEHLNMIAGSHPQFSVMAKQTPPRSFPEQLGLTDAKGGMQNHNKQTDGPPPLPEEDYPTSKHEIQIVLPQTSKDTLSPQFKQLVLPRATLDAGSPVLTGGTFFSDAGDKALFTDHTPQQKFFATHRRISSDFASIASSTGSISETEPDNSVRLRRNLSSSDAHHHASMLEKAGILNKTKITDNGKKLRKNWAQSWSVLHGGILTFYKDPKSNPGGNVTKTNQIVPEFTVELKGASVNWAMKEKSSKKNVLELRTRHDSEYLIQYDTDSIIHDWHKILLDTIKHLNPEHCSEEEDDEVMDKSHQPQEKEKKATTSRQSSTSGTDTEQGRVRNKLRKFLQRRPTLQSVKEKGYIKDNVFGCHLVTLCNRENTKVPRFVEKCIKTVEKRGLDIDGLYRVSGNLAVIQKLRHKADHEDDLDLDDGQWDEIHVITGALKLFFRELPEPLFPYSDFNKFIAAIQLNDKTQRVSYMQDLVSALPVPNYDTMEVLFRHLCNVIKHSDANRMSFQSMAIVFGPTLLRPEEEPENMVHMIYQNQIVELILSKFNEVFTAR